MFGALHLIHFIVFLGLIPKIENKNAVIYFLISALFVG
jgi:hypothetical protein